MAKHRDYRCKPGWKLLDNKGNLNKQGLNDFLKDLTDWARDVRIDIVRLEARCGLPPGDPGEPPPPPE